MNSLFNYELDEKQIRLTLHDAELEYSSAAWLDFDSNYSENTVKTHKNPLANLPKISLNINRNVLVPIFFIIGLGGVSAIMFRFIDLKSTEPQQTEKALIPNADNYKIEKKTIPPPIKKETPPPVVAVVKKDSVVVPVNTNTVATTLVSNTVVASPTPTFAPQTTQRNYTATTDTNSTKTILVQPAVQFNQYPNRRRKRRRVTAEQLDAIKPAPLLTQETSESEAEPELKIKTKDAPPN